MEIMNAEENFTNNKQDKNRQQKTLHIETNKSNYSQISYQFFKSRDFF